MTIKDYTRNSRFTLLKKYDYFAKQADFMEATEWANGEGFDVNISSKLGNQNISLTWGEYKALKALVKPWV